MREYGVTLLGKREFDYPTYFGLRYFGLRGGLSDRLLAQPLICTDLSGSMLSQSKHLNTGVL
jgi:hypothetical protein